MTDLTDARLREIAENRYAPTQSVYSDLERAIASALLRTREERDAAVARAEAAEALLRRWVSGAYSDLIEDDEGNLTVYCGPCGMNAENCEAISHEPGCIALDTGSFLSQHSPATAPDATVSGAEKETQA